MSEQRALMLFHIELNTTATGANNVTASVNNANVKVVSTTKNAEGTPANANVVASFEIHRDRRGYRF